MSVYVGIFCANYLRIPNIGCTFAVNLRNL